MDNQYSAQEHPKSNNTKRWIIILAVILMSACFLVIRAILLPGDLKARALGHLATCECNIKFNLHYKTSLLFWCEFLNTVIDGVHYIDIAF
jgi:hypothetical protein